MIGNVPDTVGVPLSEAVPSPLSVKVRPAGSVPVSLMAAVGKPVVMMVKPPLWPVVNVDVSPLGKL